MSDWIEQYAQWSMKRSPLSPKHFHENIALSLAAGAIAGRACLKLPHGTIYPNLYTLILAYSTVFGKTTTFNWARELVKQTMLDKVITEISTPEAMLELLSGQKPMNYSEMTKEQQAHWSAGAKWQGRRLFMLDEAGRIFNILKRDYNSDLGDLFMNLYDPQNNAISRNTRKRGFETVEKFALSCLFATTPRGVRDAVSSFDLWGSGFWVRWNFVSQVDLTEWKESTYGDPPNSLVNTLKNLSCKWLEPYNDKPKVLAPDPSFLKEFNETTKLLRQQSYETEDERVRIALGRLPTAHVKAAIVYALLESEGTVQTLKRSHWDRVKPFVDGWLRDAQIAIDLASQSERMTMEERIYQYIFANAGSLPTNRDIARALKFSMGDVGKVTELFLKGKDIVEVPKGRTVGYKPNYSTRAEK